MQAYFISSNEHLYWVHLEKNAHNIEGEPM